MVWMRCTVSKIKIVTRRIGYLEIDVNLKLKEKERPNRSGWLAYLCLDAAPASSDFISVEALTRPNGNKDSKMEGFWEMAKKVIKDGGNHSLGIETERV
ncbi:ankyrin repeat domain-containing protein 13C-B-like [Gossypium australe]|uniref:Ankyrin repeat domain-containing protein 13C-B-like n=1 Tax=Gossypium australe TaxID=47621 RepID=A0A5B6WWY0_9ROSI|nr:ankyrin repeat domain-containing protein 13C-B-like [Gossypium australe]